MSRRQSKNDDKRGGGPSSQPASASGRNRGLQVAIAVVSLAVGAVAVERVTRPNAVGPSSSPESLDLPVGSSRISPPPPPEPATPTFVEAMDEGKQLGSEIARQFPDSAESMAIAGQVLFAFGSVEQARDCWQRAIELDPQLADAWLGMAELTHRLGEFDKTVECMRRLAEIDANLATEKVFYLADSLLKLGRPEEAVEELETIGATTPLPSGARVTLGQAYCQQKQYEKAAEQFRLALDDPQQASVAHYGLSTALMRLGDVEQARQHRDEYARLQEKNMETFDRMQRAGGEGERVDPAPLYPILAKYHFEAARLYAIRGQREPAENHALRAWALVPDRPEPRALLESFYEQ
ncbi:MAG: tetratricopeptide repeat protein [Planctomycetes bacterium]|nr:tetratricopeptide repeat protein [Planctomycetota bacterium]